MNQEVKTKKPFYKRWWFIVLVVVVIAAAASGGDESPSTESASSGQEDTNTSSNGEDKVDEVEAEEEVKEEPKEEEPKKTEYKAGMYKVGEDFPPGQYVLIASGMAYFEITTDSSGTFDSIVANDNFGGSSIVTVSDGQYIKLQRAKAIPIEEVTDELTPKDGKYEDGTFRVGIDIPAGEYKVYPGAMGMGYIQVSSDTSHSLGSIISNDNLSSEIYQTLTEGTYLKLSNGAYIEVE